MYLSFQLSVLNSEIDFIVNRGIIFQIQCCQDKTEISVSLAFSEVPGNPS